MLVILSGVAGAGKDTIKKEIIKRMEDMEFEIGNHTYHHVKLTQYPPEVVSQQIEGTNAELINILGHGASLVRPPYGAVNETVRASLAYPFAFWSVDTLDWKHKDANKIYDTIMSEVKDGDIILRVQFNLEKGEKNSENLYTLWNKERSYS